MGSLFDDIDDPDLLKSALKDIPKTRVMVEDSVSRIQALEDRIRWQDDRIRQQDDRIKLLEDRIKELESRPIGYEHVCTKCEWKWKSWDESPRICAKCHVRNWKAK